MNLTPSEVEAVVARLSKPQRKAMLTDSSRFALGHVGKIHCRTITTARRLWQAGLIERCDTLSLPTAKGLAVRAHLKDHPNVG